jgi:hypothetical protein
VLGRYGASPASDEEHEDQKRLRGRKVVPAHEALLRFDGDLSG